MNEFHMLLEISPITEVLRTNLTLFSYMMNHSIVASQFSISSEQFLANFTGVIFITLVISFNVLVELPTCAKGFRANLATEPFLLRMTLSVVSHQFTISSKASWTCFTFENSSHFVNCCFVTHQGLSARKSSLANFAGSAFLRCVVCFGHLGN